MTQNTAEATVRVQVGNVPTSTSEAQLRALFMSHGDIASYERPVDAHTEQLGAYVYLEMAPADAASAIKALNGREMGDRKLTVNAARPFAEWAPEAGRRPASPAPRRTVTPQTSRSDAPEA